MASITPDSEREVSVLDDNDIEIVSDQAPYSPDWSEAGEDPEARLFAERPPHWDV